MENKKSFIAYCDWKNTFDILPDDKAGKLIKHILDYVNDLNPESEDLIINLAFQPIKQTLKRDLEKWESERMVRSEAGKKGMKNRWNKPITKDNSVINDITKDNSVIKSITDDNTGITKITDSVSVSVSVSDSVNVKEEKENIFNFKKSLLELGIDNQIVSDWLKVRSKKKAANTETAFNAIKSEIEKSGKTANECIKEAVIKNWCGFKAEWIKNSGIQRSTKLA